VNLAKGQLGEDSSAVLGGLLVSTLGLAGLSRADAPASDRRPFFVYADEFQTFTTLSVVSMMSELRKYGVGLTLSHQHLQQLEPEVRAAVLGNAGTLIAFRVSAEDATRFAAEFQSTADREGLTNLPNFRINLRLMIDGAPSTSFSAEATPSPLG
jgi:type IV secretory pathway TraG/TraD family ATPase VirD4